MAEGAAGLHRAVLGVASPQEARAWLDRHIATYLHTTIASVSFQAGAIDAVFGLRLADGRDVVLKALRGGADLDRIHTVVRCQTLLSQRGFGCPGVINGPNVTDGVVAIVEHEVRCESSGSPHDAAARVAMAAALARQITLLRDTDGARLLHGRPAWTSWDAGAWPHPHDPIFDFATPIDGFGWIDEAADAAAVQLRETADWHRVIGHSDWVWQNVCVVDGRFVAAYDWNSLVFAPESVIAGLCAGAFTQGAPEPPDAPSWPAVLRFLDSYTASTGIAFDPAQRRAAEAAARWVRCYNARCQIDNQVRRGLAPPRGSFVEALAAEVD